MAIVSSSTINLPMTDASEAWMADEETIAMIESEDDADNDEDVKPEAQETPEKEPEQSIVETKPSTINLLMTDASDAWMADEETIAMIESEDDADNDEEVKPETPEKEP